MDKKRGQNEGSIRQRKDGKWEARYTAGKNPNGRLNQKSVYGKTYTEVKNKLKVILADIVKGDYLNECKISLYAWLIDWLDTYKKTSIKESTYESHKNAIDVHIKTSTLANTALSKLTPRDFQKFYNKKLETLAPATIKRLHVVVKNALKQAVDCDMIRKNPCDKVSPPAMVKTEVQIMNKEEQQKFIQALKDEKLRLVFLFAMQTGIRRGELLALRWTDIDYQNKIVTIRRNVQRVNKRLLIQEPKTKSSRRNVPLLSDMIKELHEYKSAQNINKIKNRKGWDKDNYIFCNEYGQIIDPRRFTEEFKKLLNKAKIPDFNFHSIRHTFVSRLLEAGENIKTIAELIGHTKISYMLETYAHILPENKSSAIEKLDVLFKSK